MRMKFFNSALGLMAAVVLMASCSTTNKSVTTVPVTLTSQSNPLKADFTVDMKSKISGTSKSVWLLGYFRIAGDRTYADGVNYSANFGSGQEGFMRLFGLFSIRKVTQTKAAAAYNAVEGSGADFIADPHYSIKQTKVLFGLIKTYEAEVTGYKGKVTRLYQGEYTLPASKH